MSDRGQRGSWDDPLEGIDFEEFELREPEDWEVAEDLASHSPLEPNMACPSCGASQSTSNRHCEQCGARLGQQTIAVAAPPLRSVTAGGRALVIIVVVIALVVVAALVIQAIRADDEPSDASATETETEVEPITVPTTQALGPLGEIKPISVNCSTVLAESDDYACSNLIDGQDTYWNDAGLKGEDAWIRVTFVNPVALESIQIVNVADEEKFRRNYRVRAVEIEVDDQPGMPFVSPELANTNERPHRVSTQTTHTQELEIRITATYPSEPLEGRTAYDELAIQELRFFGRVHATSAPETTSTTG